MLQRKGKYTKACSKIGCNLKQIFAEISAVYGSSNVSYDPVPG